MKRSRMLAVFLAASIVVLTGCSGSKPAPSSSQAPAAPASSRAASESGSAAPESAGWKPEKPVTFLVGNSAGGGADIFARTLAKVITDNKLCEQPVTVLNKPGGSHSVAWSWLHEQTGDCYTLGTISSSFYTAPLTGNSPVHPDDFVKVVHLCKDPALLLVPGNSPYNTLEELLAYAKENPGKLKYAGSGNLSDDNFICYMINQKAGVEIEYVPFTSGGDMLTAALGGHVDMALLGPSEAAEHLTNGGLKVLAACAFERLEILPDVPTFAELGYDITQQQSRGMAMEKTVPEEVVAYYSDLLLKAAATPEWQEYLAGNCMVEMPMGYKEYAEYDKEIIANYEALIEGVGKSDA